MNSITEPNTEVMLAKLCYDLQLGLRLSERPLKVFDSCLEKLNEFGLFHESFILGPVVLRRSFGINGPSDSDELIQAAVTTDFGAAAVFWDIEDYCDAKHACTIESEAIPGRYRYEIVRRRFGR